MCMYSTSSYLYDIGRRASVLKGTCEGEVPDETLDGNDGDGLEILEVGENGECVESDLGEGVSSGV